MIDAPLPLEPRSYAYERWSPKDLTIHSTGTGENIQIKVGIRLVSADDARRFADMVLGALVPIFEIYERQSG